MPALRHRLALVYVLIVAPVQPKWVQTVQAIVPDRARTALDFALQMYAPLVSAQVD